jgi:cell division protein FtsI/penicillin-binding protein 2
MLPLTGVTLPFVAYGGSSLLTAFIAVLILLHTSHHTATRPALTIQWRPYLHLGIILFFGLIVLSLLAGWWAYFQSDALLARTDNPRRALSDRYVQRGSLLDRHNTQLAVTYGEPGSFTRQLLHPSLAPVIGYTHPVYGQTGLEASLDRYLRGLEGNQEEIVWWNNLLYGQPPPGLDVRVSLDLDLQYLIHDLIGGRTGALVLLNAGSGEVLAMSSYPTFDPNQLDDLWAELIEDPRSPLLNRATLGRYPPGSALGPLLLATAYGVGLPTLPESLSYEYDEVLLECAVTPDQPDWGNSIAGGCPAAQLILGQKIGAEETLAFFVKLGLYDQIPFHLPTSRSTIPQILVDPEGAYLGLADLQISPLHMARALAALSTGGIQPSPRLAMSIKTPHLGWSKLAAPGDPIRVIEEEQVIAATSFIATGHQPIWESVAIAPTGAATAVTWYLAGTQPDWDGEPLTLVLLLEENNPETATAIGRSIFQAALRP